MALSTTTYADLLQCCANGLRVGDGLAQVLADGLGVRPQRLDLQTNELVDEETDPRIG